MHLILRISSYIWITEKAIPMYAINNTYSCIDSVWLFILKTLNDFCYDTYLKT